MGQILLASASPRRKMLLEQLGHDVTVADISVDESERAGETPAEYLVRVVDAKLAAARQLDGWPLRLVADTIVVFDQKILHKPVEERDHWGMLATLAGRTHEVVTRFAISDGTRTHVESVNAMVEMRAIGDTELNWYIQTGEGGDKAGGYAIQGRAAAFIKRMQGSYGAIVGLPSCEVAVALARFGCLV